MKWKIDDNCVYSSKHAGWKKGKELFENDISITVCGGAYQDDNKKEDIKKIVSYICDCLNKLED